MSKKIKVRIKCVHELDTKKSHLVPEDDEPFWYINSAGDAECSCCDYAIPEYRFYLTIGNCFKTEEEAKEAIKRMQMQTKWKRLSLEAGEAENPWDGWCVHWCAEYNRDSKTIYLYQSHCIQDNNVFFPTRESLKTAISEFGKANLLKYVFGVNEKIEDVKIDN